MSEGADTITEPAYPTFFTTMQSVKKGQSQDFPGNAVVKNPPSSAGQMGLISGPETEIPHAWGQLSPCAANRRTRAPTTKSKCHSTDPMLPKNKC